MLLYGYTAMLLTYHDMACLLVHGPLLYFHVVIHHRAYHVYALSRTIVYALVIGNHVSHARNHTPHVAWIHDVVHLPATSYITFAKHHMRRAMRDITPNMGCGMHGDLRIPHCHRDRTACHT